MSALLLALSPLAHAERPPGVPVPDAVALDISPEGLDSFVPLVAGLLPSQIDVPVFEDHFCEEICIFGCFCLYEYEYSVTNGWATITIDNASITPGQGELLLDADLTVQLNDSVDPLQAYLYASGLEIIDFDQTCNAWVDPFQIDLQGSVLLDLLPDGTVVADLPPLVWDWTLTGDDMTIADCGTIDTITDILDFIGVDVFQLVLDAVEPEIEGAIDGLTADLDLQTTIQDALDSATIEEELDLAGVPLTISVAPADLDITPDGVRITLDGVIDAPPHRCTDIYGITGSLETPGDLPPIAAPVSGLPFDPHISVFADDDLLNQALFSIWRGGLLCQTIDDSMDLPVGINTELLKLISDDHYDQLFPLPEPMTIQLLPTQPPTGSVGTAHDLEVSADGLELDFYAAVDGRMTRQVTIDLLVNIGADVNFDGQTGALGVDVDFGGDSFVVEARDNEFAPLANPVIAENFVTLFDLIADPLIGGALSDLNFELPAFEGVGLEQAAVRGGGTAGDRIGIYGTMGEVAYTGPDCGGCDAGSGCGDTGGACDSTGLGGRLALLTLPLVLALLRRRNPRQV